MADPKGFLKVKRRSTQYRPVCDRVQDYWEVPVSRSEKESREQALRCMDCGTPFCHWGCPVGNLVPEWNNLLFSGHWEAAVELLEGTNNLPEITGRVCPAPCEEACVLGINDDPVTIRENELAIVEHGFREGLIKARPPFSRTGKMVAVVGSGPAGLSCAAQLNRAGHRVTVFEREDMLGGILRYGIPDFKLEKRIIERRINIYKEEGIEFNTGVDVGLDYTTSELLSRFDAVCLAGGCGVPRDLAIEGSDLKGIHFAMDYLIQSNRRVAVRDILEDEIIDARGRKVVVIGGGDTGADCMGVAHRQGADCVVQVELMPRPPKSRTEDYPWPYYPMVLRTSTSHEEGGEREWSVLTKKFVGEEGRVKQLSCVRVEFPMVRGMGRQVMREVPGNVFQIEADLVILALGFVHPDKRGLIDGLGLKLDQKGNLRTGEDYMTSLEGVFSAGDMRRGQSLIVWAIAEGRRAAHHIDRYLMGSSRLPVL